MNIEIGKYLSHFFFPNQVVRFFDNVGTSGETNQKEKRNLFHNHPNILRILNIKIPNTASPKMLEFIFDSPAMRLVKIMGTSCSLNFLRQALYFISIWKP